MDNHSGLENKNQELSYEVEVGVTFASFMSAVTLFFTGLLITQYKSFDPTIKIPLLFLIISTFSFIFAASIYSNAGVEVTSHRFKAVQKYLSYANNILEFLGLYLLILSTPLVISAVTNDPFLRITTAAIALLGLFLYSQSDFSILHKELPNKRHKLTVTIVMILLGVGLLFSQQLSQTTSFPGYDYIGSTLLLFMLIITLYFCRKSKQYINKGIGF